MQAVAKATKALTKQAREKYRFDLFCLIAVLNRHIVVVTSHL
jgi:hypothetical protein